LSYSFGYCSIQISPDGTTSIIDQKRGWNAGGCCGGSTALNVSDVAFARSLVDFARTNFEGCFPTKAVFATGFSNGGECSSYIPSLFIFGLQPLYSSTQYSGFFSHRLACEADDVSAFPFLKSPS
jgi:hypothetical protein